MAFAILILCGAVESLTQPLPTYYNKNCPWRSGLRRISLRHKFHHRILQSAFVSLRLRIHAATWLHADFSSLQPYATHTNIQCMNCLAYLLPSKGYVSLLQISQSKTQTATELITLKHCTHTGLHTGSVQHDVRRALANLSRFTLDFWICRNTIAPSNRN